MGARNPQHQEVIMLTKVVGDRVYDFSHVVGGRNEVMGPVALALGEPGELFAVITRIDKNCNVARFSIGEYQDQEELLSTFGSRGVGAGQMEWPSGIALDSDRNVYVTDAWTDSVSVFSNDGEYVRSFGSSGDGAGQFRRPSGIAIDADDNAVVVDTVNHRIQKLDKDGNPLSQWGRLGKDEGEFRSPWGIAIDGDGFIYVADHENHRVQKFDADGGFVFALGSYGDGEGEFDHPSDVAIDPDGDIYVCDYANHRVQAFDAEGNYITTFIGDAQELSKWQKAYVRANPDVYKARRRVYTLEPEWRFALPSAVAFDPHDSRLLVADTQRWRIQIYNKLNDYDEPQFNI